MSEDAAPYGRTVGRSDRPAVKQRRSLFFAGRVDRWLVVRRGRMVVRVAVTPEMIRPRVLHNLTRALLASGVLRRA